MEKGQGLTEKEIWGNLWKYYRNTAVTISIMAVAMVISTSMNYKLIPVVGAIVLGFYSLWITGMSISWLKRYKEHLKNEGA